MSRVRIVVGSASVLKLDAVHAALEMLGLEGEVVAIEAPSGVPNQPYGRTETLEGAENRARAARDKAEGAYAVGVENGLIPSGAVVIDAAFVVVFTPGDCGIPTSAAVYDAARLAKNSGRFISRNPGIMVAPGARVNVYPVPDPPGLRVSDR